MSLTRGGSLDRYFLLQNYNISTSQSACFHSRFTAAIYGTVFTESTSRVSVNRMPCPTFRSWICVLFPNPFFLNVLSSSKE